MPIIDVESEPHFMELIKHDKCIIDFYASWCTPCLHLLENLPKVIEKHPDITIAKVNVNEFDNIANQFKVKQIPHLAFFKKGELQNSILKSSDYNDLFNAINHIYN
jgi:thioredoxin 1